MKNILLRRPAEFFSRCHHRRLRRRRHHHHRRLRRRRHHLQRHVVVVHIVGLNVESPNVEFRMSKTQCRKAHCHCTRMSNDLNVEFQYLIRMSNT